VKSVEKTGRWLVGLLNLGRGALLQAMLLLVMLSGCQGGSANNQVTASQLVGVWKFTGVEFGQPIEILLELHPDGSEAVNFTTAFGIEVQCGTWQYSNGIVHETLWNGVAARGRSNWIDRNHYVLTIIDNGVPAFTGMKRHYFRQ
jgi:hypothetical protein